MVLPFKLLLSLLSVFRLTQYMVLLSNLVKMSVILLSLEGRIAIYLAIIERVITLLSFFFLAFIWNVLF